MNKGQNEPLLGSDQRREKSQLANTSAAWSTEFYESFVCRREKITFTGTGVTIPCNCKMSALPTETKGWIGANFLHRAG